MQELKICLQPKQKYFAECIEKFPIVFFGGAKGGGKSKGLQLILLLRRFQYPNSTGAIFRRTYPELEGNHIRPLFQAFPQLKDYYNEGKKLLSLPNGSTLQFCHCNNEKDVSLYQGREFHDLAIDEAGQWTENMFRQLLGSNRSSKAGINPKAILTGNPGGVGHSWLKRLFIERRFNEREHPQDYTFVQALVDDNEALMANDPDYVRKLDSEPNEALRKAYRYGSWDIFAGQYFNELDRSVHLIEPFTIPGHWERFGAYDYGYNHPAAFGWFACDSDGNVYLYRERIAGSRRIDQFAKDILEFSETRSLYKIVAGWDCWTKKGILNEQTAPTIAEEFLKHEIVLHKAKIDRVQGAVQVRNYLAWKNLTSGRNKPRFYIFNTCPITFDALTRMEYDPNHPEDVLKIDATEGDPMTGDDAYDMVRYGLMSRPALADPPKLNLKPGTDEYAAHFAKKLEERLIEKMKQEREQKDGQGRNWELDKDGIAEWNRW